jgi:hypothetical protein
MKEYFFRDKRYSIFMPSHFSTVFSTTPGESGRLFQAIDAGRDGAISVSEARVHLKLGTTSSKSFTWFGNGQ